METYIDVRNTRYSHDPEKCNLCTLEAEACVEAFDGEDSTEIFLCPFHLEMLVERAQEWIGGVE